ncbi:MAG: hypothetical protein LBS55_12200 [Prevotellaceae bacterium]|nr:hypothetical protein [Prevotellaceae bacterium]
MDRYPNLMVLISFLLLISSFKVQSQNGFSDSVYCYLTVDKKQDNKEKSGFHLQLLIYNDDKDSIVINDFNNNIYHISKVHFRANEKRVFFWDLLTLSNRTPEGVVSILPIVPIIKNSKKRNSAKNTNIVIAPNSLYVSNVFLLHSPFVAYPKGFYKLCLFYEDDKNCIAETIIEIE